MFSSLDSWQQHFNPRSLAGATRLAALADLPAAISIQAPSRELRLKKLKLILLLKFQSTLPRGSDDSGYLVPIFVDISIHAPSRERRWVGTRK